MELSAKKINSRADTRAKEGELLGMHLTSRLEDQSGSILHLHPREQRRKQENKQRILLKKLSVSILT